MFEQEQEKEIIISDDDFDNLVGFFELLLKIDMRNNPERYKIKNKENKNDRYSNTNNK